MHTNQVRMSGVQSKIMWILTSLHYLVFYFRISEMDSGFAE